MLDPIPIRNLTVCIATPVSRSSVRLVYSIEQLTSRTELPHRNKSTREVLERIVEINETVTIDEKAELVFPDIQKMYPNVDVEEGLGSVKRRLRNNPSPSVNMSPD